MYQGAICIRVLYVSGCYMYQGAICIRVLYVSGCYMYQGAICIKVLYVSGCYYSLSLTHMFGTSAWLSRKKQQPFPKFYIYILTTNSAYLN